MKGQRTRHACLLDAVKARVDWSAFERPGFRDAADHHASHSPERRAELEGEWK
jgi:hypothetical protein